jgi:hypothetical protein
MKRCPKCKSYKPFSAFGLHTYGYFNSYCRECKREYNRSRHTKKPRPFRLGSAFKVLAYLQENGDGSFLDLAKAVRPQVRTVTPAAIRTAVTHLRRAGHDIRHTYYSGYRLQGGIGATAARVMRFDLTPIPSDGP